MGRPFGTARLLIEVHAEDERRTQRAGKLDEFDPARMVAEDVADNELTAGLARRGDDALGFGDGPGERLLDEDMGAGVHRLDGIVGMGVGPGADGDYVRLEGGERFLVIGEAPGSGQCLWQRALGVFRSHVATTSKPSMRV